MDIKMPEMKELTFDEVPHIYRLDGDEIPSVSTIMLPISETKYTNISKDVLEKAARKGTAVHNAIENWINYGIEDISDEHAGYFRAFLDWWKTVNPRVIAAETRVYHKLLRYAGTSDLIAEIDGKIALVDYKTTAAISDMLCGVQLEAYAQAFESHEVGIDRKIILHLKKDGKYKIHEYPEHDADRWRVFGSLKCIYDYIRYEGRT